MGPAWGIIMAALLGSGPIARREVVVTTDCGASFDDQWALAHLALCPEVVLKGIVTTHAPNLPAPAAESSARAARAVLARLHLQDPPPVLAGSNTPLPREGRPREDRGAAFLIDQARGHSPDDRLAVLLLGAATDVAAALRADPSWADRVELVAMAFDAWPEGGDPWNVKNDVRAWQVVLASRAPLVVGDIAVTRKDLAMTAAKARALLGRRGEAGPFLLGLFEDGLARNADLARRVAKGEPALPIWDEVTTAYLLGLTTQESRPRPALRDDRTFDHARSQGTVLWITRIDSDRLWADFARRLDGAAPRR
jgi:purine nucleosidase